MVTRQFKPDFQTNFKAEPRRCCLKPLESIAPLVLRELSEHDEDYLTKSPAVLRTTPTVPRKKGGEGEAPAFKRAAAAGRS